MTNETATEPEVTDPHELLESGQELATLAQLARLLSCSARMLNELLQGPLNARVRFVRRKPGPWLYSVTDARVAVEPYRAAIEARRQRAIELEASNRAAKAARIAASQVAPPKPEVMVTTPIAKPAAKPSPVSTKQPPMPKSRAPSPEVIVLPRRPSVRP
jgi:hypothetical protein